MTETFLHADKKIDNKKKSTQFLPHSNTCFQCDIAVTNFLGSHTCKIRFHDVIYQGIVHMYSYAKVLKHD